MSNSLLEPNKDILERISHYEITDIGEKRENNQDNFIVVTGENFKYFVVCDGMGGTDGGEIASQMTVSYLDSELKGKKINDIDDVKKVVFEANELVFQYGSSHKEVQGLGTTITSLLVMQKGSWILNVGDSRVYKIVGNTINQITDDDTVLNELIKSGVISPEKAKSHPIANMLTKTIGQGKSLEIETKRLGFLDESEKYLLCSDGLYNMVSDEKILEILKTSGGIREGVKKLIDTANENGGVDNITAMLVGMFHTQLANEEEKSKQVEKKRYIKTQEISMNLDYNEISHKIDDFKHEEPAKKSWSGSVKNKDRNVDMGKDDLKNLTHIILLVVLCILGFIFIKPSKLIKLGNTNNNDKLVERIGNIEVAENDYKFTINRTKNNNNLKNDYIDSSRDEIRAYDDILSMIEENREVSKEKLQKEEDFLKREYNAVTEEINELTSNIKIYTDYDNKNLLSIARDFSNKDKNIKKLSDDFLSFQYSVNNNGLNQEVYNKTKEEKYSKLYNAINTYINDKISVLENKIKDNKKKLIYNQLNRSIIDLKLEYANIQESQNQDKLRDFKIKIESLKQSVSSKN